MTLKELILLALLFVASFSRISSEEEGHCILNEDGTKECHGEETHKHTYTAEEQTETKSDKILYSATEGLTRRDGVEVGHVEKVDVGDGKVVDVITRSMRPLLFEIPDFLSDEECDHIIKRAQDPEEGGMFSSRAKGGLTPKYEYKFSGKRGSAGGFYSDFELWDKNKDGVADIEEIVSVIHARRTIILEEEDVRKMFKTIEETAIDNDDVIDKEEFDNLNTIGMEDYVHGLINSDPRFMVRHSEQAWLFMEQWIDPTIHKIREKLVKLTGLPRKIIYGGEQLQVLRYPPRGHYHAHHDSETHKRHEVPCCHQYDGDVLESVGECKLCRYITFMLYLNDVEEGGETAFPVAEDTSYDPENLRAHGNTSSDKYNLSHGCKRANLVVKAKKRQAVLWYNHLRNETDGWMGELDLYSLHGGCDVIKGEKWISNMWIPAPFGKAKEKPSIYLNKRDYEFAEFGVDPYDK